MDDAFDQVLRHYNDRAERERNRRHAASVDDLLLHVGEKVARVLHSLAIARGAKRIVELGTSYGYSTLFLADAAKQTGGRLITFDLAENKQAYARERLGEAGLADHVDWMAGDALELLDDLEGPVDFVLIDLWKDLYVPCFEKLYPKLAENALLAADNMIYPEGARRHAVAYSAAVRGKPDMESVLLPIGSGIELSCRWRKPIF